MLGNSKQHCYVIAEAGVNHNGVLENAFRLVDAAVDAGADAIKFQTFNAAKLVTKKASKADYQKDNTEAEESQFEMLKKLELSEADHEAIYAYSQEKGIHFLSTAFDLDSLDFLDRYQMCLVKVSSGEITNYPFLKAVARRGKPVVLSTGMCNLAEIEVAIGVLEQELKREDIIVLHCNTQYPTPFEDVNLNAIKTIERAFPGVLVGYSDHTLGIEVPIACVALGSTVIEKHFTLCKEMEGPDHAASLDPTELKAMVASIRNISQAMGDGIKQASPSEAANRAIVRKSIRAAVPISKGEQISESMLTVKRPGDGRSPMDWNILIGSTAQQDYEIDDAI